MLLVELAYLGRFGLLQLYQSRPLLQKIAGHGSVQLAGPGERLRKVLFERLREHIGDDDSAPDGVATKLRQFLQRPGLRLIGSPDFYSIPVIPGPFEQEAGIGNIVLGATGVEGLPIPGQRLGRDAQYMDKAITEQRIGHRSAALLNSDDHISSAESIAQTQDPIMQGLGCLFDGLCLDPAGASCLQRDRMLLVSPIEPDTSGVLLLLVGSIGLHGCLLPVVLRTRWLWSCAILIVESSVGTASEYALLDQSASSRSKLFGKPSKRLERDIRSGAMRVQIKLPPLRVCSLTRSVQVVLTFQKNCVSIRDWGSAAKSGCRTTIRSGGSLARGERFCEPLDTGHPKISAPAGAGGLKISWQIPRQASLCLWKGAMTNAIDTSELELPYRLQYQESRTDSGGIMACRTACLSWRNSPRPGRRRPGGRRSSRSRTFSRCTEGHALLGRRAARYEDRLVSMDAR